MSNTKYYYAWVGSNATTGQPHRVTGRYNRWGELRAFSTKGERDKFCDTYHPRYNAYPVPTNKREAKSAYFAGCTQLEFDEYLHNYVNFDLVEYAEFLENYVTV